MERFDTPFKALIALESIPEEEWLTLHYSNGKDKCCAIGHLCRLENIDTNQYKGYLWKSSRFNHPMNKFRLVKVNDNKNPKYKQNTPKKRVIAYLTDLIERTNL